MNFSKINLFFCLLFFTFIGLIGCQKEPIGKAPTPVLDTDKLAQNVKESFANKVVGYGWAAYQNGEMIKAGGGGWARAAGFEVSPVAYTPYTTGTVFSTSKTITAATFIDQIDELEISLDEPIKNYLPIDWRIHESHDGITFRHLLNHTSGLTGTHDGYVAMKEQLQKPSAGTFGSEEYSNLNYTLFRVLIPYLYYSVEVDNKTQISDQAVIDFIAEKI